jgi:hypothetical protein
VYAVFVFVDTFIFFWGGVINTHFIPTSKNFFIFIIFIESSRFNLKLVLILDLLLISTGTVPSLSVALCLDRPAVRAGPEGLCEDAGQGRGRGGGAAYAEGEGGGEVRSERQEVASPAQDAEGAATGRPWSRQLSLLCRQARI